MGDTKLDQKIGKKKAFDVIKSEGFFQPTTFDVRDADTGKLKSWSRSRAEATEKAEKLAREN